MEDGRKVLCATFTQLQDSAHFSTITKKLQTDKEAKETKNCTEKVWLQSAKDWEWKFDVFSTYNLSAVQTEFISSRTGRVDFVEGAGAPTRCLACRVV